MSETNPPHDHYIIRGGGAGRDRLEVLHRALAPTTLAFFDRSGLAPGHRGLDLGCGGGRVTFDLAKRVGPEGSVTGIDKDAENISFARKEAERKRMSHVDFQEADLREWEKAAVPYDFAYARFLLTHLADPADMIRKIYRTLKPGGRILLEDIDFTGHFCYPACEAFDEYVQLYTAAVQRTGADPNIGPRLPSLVREAGFRDLQFTVVQPVFRTEEGKQMSSLTLESIANSLIRHQLATKETIEAHLSRLKAFEEDENTLVSLPRIFQVCAVK